MMNNPFVLASQFICSQPLPASANCISYTRFSSYEQMHGDSKRRQTDMAAAYCIKHGLVLAESLEDLGVSAYRSKNLQHC